MKLDPNNNKPHNRSQKQAAPVDSILTAMRKKTWMTPAERERRRPADWWPSEVPPNVQNSTNLANYSPSFPLTFLPSVSSVVTNRTALYCSLSQACQRIQADQRTQGIGSVLWGKSKSKWNEFHTTLQGHATQSNHNLETSLRILKEDADRVLGWKWSLEAAAGNMKVGKLRRGK